MFDWLRNRFTYCRNIINSVLIDIDFTALSFSITKGSVHLIKAVDVCGKLLAQNSFYTSLIKVVVLSVFWGRKWSREYYLVFFNNHIWHTFSWRFIIKRSKGDGNRILVRNILAQQIHFVLWVFKLLYGILKTDKYISDQNSISVSFFPTSTKYILIQKCKQSRHEPNININQSRGMAYKIDLF